MKTVSTTTLDKIKYDHHNEVSTSVIAEWNLNRYHAVVADNSPTEDSEGYDIEMFPIESIVLPMRPTAGIAKAVTNDSRAYHDDGTVPATRFYLADPDDTYKYWQSPEPAAGAVTGGFGLSKCAPYILYMENDGTTPKVVTTNKITFTFENAYSSPTKYNVQVKTTTGGEWTTIASDLPVPASGKVILWRGASAWSTTRSVDFETQIHGVRLVITAMDKPAYLNLIELSARLERDISKDVMNWNSAFTMGERDFITPLGKVSSNNSTLSLFHEDAVYSTTNEDSPYAGMLHKGVRITAFTHYGSEKIQEFEGWTEKWTGDHVETNVTLTDKSFVLMENKPRSVLYTNITITEAIWRVCDLVGFTDYELVNNTGVAVPRLSIFWTDGEKTAWEVISEICSGTQTAVFFDSYGKMQIRTKNNNWDALRPVDFTLTDRTLITGQLPNIESMDEEVTSEPNKVTVNWTPMHFSKSKYGISPFETVWEPEGSVVLRSTPIMKSLSASDVVVQLSTVGGRTWPFKGILQIEGEFIKYKAKRYAYMDGNTQVITWVSSQEEVTKLNRKTPDAQLHKNFYTGALLVEERGAFNTDPKPHYVDIAGWIRQRVNNFSTTKTPAWGVTHDKKNSKVTLRGAPKATMRDYMYLHRGNLSDFGYSHVGARWRIDKSGHRDKRAGIFFMGDGPRVGAGYYVEITATAKMNAKTRKTGHELVFYSMKPDGTKRKFGGRTIRIKNAATKRNKNDKITVSLGVPLAVPMNRLIDVDVKFEVRANGDHVFHIFAMNRLMFTATVPDGSGWRHSSVSRMGMYVRGRSKATFDYMYGVNGPEVEPVDTEGETSKIRDGYWGSQFMLDYIYTNSWRRRKIRKRWTKVRARRIDRYMDEFGPIAHEVREFDVKFTSETPVLESKLFFSNTRGAVCMEYVGSPTGAKFLMANMSRANSIVHGDDEATGRGEGSIDQKLIVFGRPVIKGDEQKIVKENALDIKKNGTVELEFESPWIQSEEQANDFADWMVNKWNSADIELSGQIFGNPLLELGDVVRVVYGHIDDKFFVTEISNTYDAGLATSVVLRKTPVV